MTALEPFLFADFLGTATWLWLVFIAVVISLLAFDLGVLHRDAHEIDAVSLGKREEPFRKGAEPSFVERGQR